MARSARTRLQGDAFASHWDDSPQLAWAQGAGLTVIRGRARLAGERTVDVEGADGTRRLTARQVHAEGYTGQARMVVDTERKVLVGVTFVGQDVAELAHAATIAIAGEVPLHRLWHAVPMFPTISEIWLRLLESYGM